MSIARGWRSLGTGITFCVANIGCWAIVGAAFCGYAFYQGLLPQGPDAPTPSWLYGTLAGVLYFIAMIFAAYWVVIPALLLVIGLGLMAGIPGPQFRWSAAWTLLAVAGLAPDAIVLWAANPFHPPLENQLAFLGCAVGYLAIGTAMTRILIVRSRSALPPPGTTAAAAN
jgi:hypothetical protein